MTITRDQVIWVYRNILGREPENEQVIYLRMQHVKDRTDLILDAINSQEFRSRHPNGVG